MSGHLHQLDIWHQVGHEATVFRFCYHLEQQNHQYYLNKMCDIKLFSYGTLIDCFLIPQNNLIDTHYL